MIVVPYYDLILIPEVTYYFKGDYLADLLGQKPRKDEKLLFVMVRSEKKRENITADDLYPIGVTATIGDVEEENCEVLTHTRVTLDTVEVHEGEIEVTYAERPTEIDVTPEQQKERFEGIRNALIRFVNGFPWGMMAKNYIRHWKTMDEMGAAMSQHLNISNEEKYKILEADTLSERHTLIERAVFEMIEMTRVGK